MTNYPDFPRIASEVGEVVGSDGLNLLINNAGIMNTTSLAEVTADQMMECYKANTIGPVLLAQVVHVSSLVTYFITLACYFLLSMYCHILYGILMFYLSAVDTYRYITDSCIVWGKRLYNLAERRVVSVKHLGTFVKESTIICSDCIGFLYLKF